MPVGSVGGQKFAYDGSHVVYTAELIQGQKQVRSAHSMDLKLKQMVKIKCK